MANKQLDGKQQADLVDKMKRNIKSAMDKVDDEATVGTADGPHASATSDDPRIEPEPERMEAGAQRAELRAVASGRDHHGVGDLSTSECKILC